mmetsp:Transcript_8676/g.21688  ORF Transcript_8676/g.21688 Transcript_8676/m.21688 type:complete len:571 (+) Transcript_8676:724-2436(+)
MAATEADPSLEQAILAFLRQQEENQLSSEEGQENPIVNGTSSMGLPEDIEPHLAAAKANMLKQGPALAAGGSEVVKNLTPFALQIGGSALAYNVGLGIFQLVGLGMRVSCNSSLWGPCLGCLGVGVASALAGHASRRVHKGLASGRPLANELLAVPPWQGWQMEQALMDALVGMSAFKVLGGQFRRIMPSDLRYPGAFAKGSMPTTRSAKDDSTAYLQHGPTRVHLEKMLIKDGCHSCGKRGGGLHADHMPPNKLYKEAKAQAERRASQPHRVYLNKAAGKLPKPLRDRARELMIGLFDSAPPGQHFYPHCTSCSNKQGQLLANGSRGPLVWHRLGVPPGSMPGILAGFRFFTNPPSPPPSSTGGKGGRRGKQAPPHKQQQQQQGPGLKQSIKDGLQEVKASLPAALAMLRRVWIVDLLFNLRALPLQGLSLLVLPVFWTVPRLLAIQLAVPVAIMEGRSGNDALARSSRLMDGFRSSYGWPFVALILAVRFVDGVRNAALTALPSRWWQEVIEMPILLTAIFSFTKLLLIRLQDLIPLAAYMYALKLNEEERQGSSQGASEQTSQGSTQ